MGHPLLNRGGSIEQEVLTPPPLIARVMLAFGGRSIALDPCAPTKNEPSFFAERYVREADDGLGVSWVDRTFANPPFSDLEEWLAKAVAEANRPDAPRIVVLAPWRSHRAWFLDALKASPRRPTVTLEPGVRFVGHAAKFPAPIALVAWGCVVPPTPEGVVGQFLSHAEITT